MRKQWASEQPLHSSQLRTRMAATMENAITPALLRRHGLGRFSLRRLFGSLSFGRRTIARRCATNIETDSRSENGSLTLSVGEHKHAQAAANDRVKASVESLNNGDGTAEPLVECPVCLSELPPQCFPILSTCRHHTCYDCFQRYLQVEISESRVGVTCPMCPEPLHPNDIRMILNDESFTDKYEAFMLRRVLVTEPDARWCPAPDCGYVVIASSCASCPKLRCERPGCDTYFCYHCKHEWHPNQTCDSARAQRHPVNPHSASSVSFSQDSFTQRDDIKPCPCCKVPIIKMDDGSCNHMTCGVCSTEFCWLCMKEISDLHYLSPSGCTFWGKKPWSRKKKILWQLGMLVGAPVGIALIAGIAVPAIIIGIPVWVGQKLHTRYKQQVGSKHKRNLMVSGGVIASIVVSPILAGITVGIGVPILLAYVYGVVPISLCRSGGCGVTTSASGVRIEFDEDEPVAIPDGSGTGVVNPSIGEASLGMSVSLSLGSGSHLERESASNTAIAGSIASAAAASHKLEVQADVSSNKRFSLSSHSETASATVSLSERSANLADDAASTKALAGSLLGYRDSGAAAVTPVEVHVDAAGYQEPSCCAVHRSSLLRSKAKYAEDSTDQRECIVSFIDESQGSLEKPEFELEQSSEPHVGGIKRKASTKSVRLTYMQCKEDLRSAGDGEAWHSSHHHHGARLPDSRSLDHLYSICSHCNGSHFPSPEDGSHFDTTLNCSSSAINTNPCSDCTVINMSS